MYGKRLRFRGGFTLVEVAVAMVVLIIATLGGLAY
ncbi:MAG: prepilin-type N-terminal cleavage/methylation domain-containing protein [Sedimentisphaerales bacterium]|nr:prepilin-type N-terminal cleavage/methylation domain-containing protein [Sedimentisphaerales bacterium]